MNRAQGIIFLLICTSVIATAALAFAVGAKYAYVSAHNRAMHNADAYIKANCGMAAIDNGFDLNLTLWPKSNLTNTSALSDS